MPLQQSPTAVPLFGGLDTKTDPKFVAPDKLITANNVQYPAVSSVSKRYGQTALSASTTDGSTITEGRALGTFNRELLLYDGSKLYTEAQASNKFAPIGALNEVVVDVENVFRGVGNVQGVVSVRTNTCECYVFEYSTGGVYYLLRDPESGSLLKSATLIDISGSAPRVVTIGESIYIFYISHYLKAARISVNSPASGIIQTYTVSTNINTAYPYAVAVNPQGDNLLLLYQVLTHALYWSLTSFNQYLIVNQQTNSGTGGFDIGTPSYLQIAWSYPGRDAISTMTSAVQGKITITGLDISGGSISWSDSMQATVSNLHRAVSVAGGYSGGPYWQLYWSVNYGTQMPYVASVGFVTGV